MERRGFPLPRSVAPGVSCMDVFALTVLFLELQCYYVTNCEVIYAGNKNIE